MKGRRGGRPVLILTVALSLTERYGLGLRITAGISSALTFRLNSGGPLEMTAFSLAGCSFSLAVSSLNTSYDGLVGLASALATALANAASLLFNLIG